MENQRGKTGRIKKKTLLPAEDVAFTLLRCFSSCCCYFAVLMSAHELCKPRMMG